MFFKKHLTIYSLSPLSKKMYFFCCYRHGIFANKRTLTVNMLLLTNIKIHTGGSSVLCPHRSRTVILVDRNTPEVSLLKICIIA